MMLTEMNLCFDEELLEVLGPEETIFVNICVEGYYTGDSSTNYMYEFYNSSAYLKLLDYYMHEMPYGVAKGRTGEPDYWIISKLRERQLSTC